VTLSGYSRSRASIALQQKSKQWSTSLHKSEFPAREVACIAALAVGQMGQMGQNAGEFFGLHMKRLIQRGTFTRARFSAASVSRNFTPVK
jgi:hypothetical protein